MASKTPQASGGKTPSTQSSSNEATEEPQEDLTLFVQDMLDQMSSRFSAMGDSIMGQMDQMGSRMSELESSINQLMLQAGLTPTESLPPSTLDSSGKKPNTVSI